MVTGTDADGFRDHVFASRRGYLASSLRGHIKPPPGVSTAAWNREITSGKYPITETPQPAESPHSPSTRYLFRKVVVLVAVVTSAMVVPNPSSFVSVVWWRQVQRWFCGLRGLLSYIGEGSSILPAELGVAPGTD